MQSTAPPTRPPQPRESSLASTMRADFLASIIVFLVALPLCLGIARACGLPPALGLITGIVGGLLVAPFAGSPLQVSGPAAGLIVLIAGIVKDYPGHETIALGLVVLIAGVIQFGAGLLKLGQWFRAVAPAVIEGMLAGIGVLIFASQFHIMVDGNTHDHLKSLADALGVQFGASVHESGLASILSLPVALWKGLVPSGGATHHLAARLGLLTIAIIIAWKLLMPKKVQLVPGPLVAVVAGSALAALLGWTIQKVALPDNLWQAVTLPTAESLRLLADPEVWTAGLTIALVASAETLLCAAAVDQMHTGPRTRFDRELTAQGMGNFVCGILGALPMTGVIVRSATNVAAGGRTRWSAFMHGLWLLLFVLALPGVLKLIPTSCLAGILVYTGFKLINVKQARRLYRDSRGEFFIYLTTIVTIVVTDLLTGVIAGIVFSAIKLLYTFSELKIRLKDHPERRTTTLHLEGAATFIRLPTLAATLEKVPVSTELHVHFEKLSYIDHACLELLLNWEKQHQAVGGALVIDWGRLRAKFKHPKFRPSDSQVEVDGAHT